MYVVRWLLGRGYNGIGLYEQITNLFQYGTKHILISIDLYSEKKVKKKFERKETEKWKREKIEIKRKTGKRK